MRKHGPYGYSAYSYYRNWLRDEFAFRCIYCLRRESWLTTRRDYEIDHFLPKSMRPDVERDYDNLVFACRMCNGTKAAKYLPAPEQVAYGDYLLVDRHGHIHATREPGITIIEALRLDGPDYTRLRRRVIQIVAEASIGSRTMAIFLGYPEDLPDLRQERTPEGNSRPDGILNSHFERHQRGELPEYY